MKGAALLLVAVLATVVFVCSDAAAKTLGDECAEEFQKVTTCLSFATGKAATPTKDCCNSVTEIKGSKPECLCYVIEQIHNGTNPQLKSMGIQEARLLQLPSACKLANASSADCPKLLNLPPGSPEAALFTNTSAPATPTTSPGTSSPVSTDNSNNVYKHGGPQLAGSVAITVAAAVFFSALIST